MLLLYGYADSSCSACDQLKHLLTSHRIEYTFIPVIKGQHPFKTVPQTLYTNGSLAGNLSDWKKILRNSK